MAATAKAPAQREPKQCERPGCPSTFIPAHAAHKFCSTRCKRSCQNYRHVLRLR